MKTIKDASFSEVEIIQDIAEKTWWPVYSPILQKEQIEYMLASIYSTAEIHRVMQDGSQRFILVYEDEVPKGFASYGESNRQSETWKIAKLYVLPDEHGKGFGRMLLDEIRSRAKEEGVKTLALNVNRHNPALNFYRKYGFEVLREEDIPIGPYFMNDFVLTIAVS